MPRVSQQYKDRQRAEILAAARRCFVRNGFHRTSMQDIFAEAGRSAGAVYRYFPAKEDIIVAVASGNLDDIQAVLHSAVARTDEELGVGDVVAELLEAVVQRDRERQLASVALMVWSEALRDAALAERLKTASSEMRRDVTAFLLRRRRTGGRTEDSAVQAAQVIMSVLPGFLLDLALQGPDAVRGVPDAAARVFTHLQE